MCYPYKRKVKGKNEESKLGYYFFLNLLGTQKLVLVVSIVYCCVELEEGNSDYFWFQLSGGLKNCS